MPYQTLSEKIMTIVVILMGTAAIAGIYLGDLSRSEE